METDEILVSIVVPVYNVEPYLEESLRSLEIQTHENLEIFLVDDGSTDGSPAICDGAAEKDPRFQVIHQKNGGVSQARNTGLSRIHGQYLFFMDPDDVLSPECIETLLEAVMTTHADMAMGEHVNFQEKLEFPALSGEVTVRTGRDALHRILGREHVRYTVVHNKIYKSEIFRELRFPVGRIHEDEAVMYRVYYGADTVADVHAATYGYRQRPQSITTDDYSEKRLEGLEILRKRAEFFKEKKEAFLYENFQWAYAMLLLQHYPRVRKDLKNPALAGKLRKEYRSIAPELMTCANLSKKRKLMTAAFYCFPSLYAPLMDLREKSINPVRN